MDAKNLQKWYYTCLQIILYNVNNSLYREQLWGFYIICGKHNIGWNVVGITDSN